MLSRQQQIIISTLMSWTLYMNLFSVTEAKREGGKGGRGGVRLPGCKRVLEGVPSRSRLRLPPRLMVLMLPLTPPVVTLPLMPLPLACSIAASSPPHGCSPPLPCWASLGGPGVHAVDALPGGGGTNFIWDPSTPRASESPASPFQVYRLRGGDTVLCSDEMTIKVDVATVELRYFVMFSGAQ